MYNQEIRICQCICSYHAYRHLLNWMCSNFYFFCNNYGFISGHKMSYYDVILQPKQCKCFPFDHVQTVFCNQVSNWSINCSHVDNGMHEDVKDNNVVLLICVIV